MVGDLSWEALGRSGLHLHYVAEEMEAQGDYG